MLVDAAVTSSAAASITATASSSRSASPRRSRWATSASGLLTGASAWLRSPISNPIEARWPTEESGTSSPMATRVSARGTRSCNSATTVAVAASSCSSSGTPPSSSSNSVRTAPMASVNRPLKASSRGRRALQASRAAFRTSSAALDILVIGRGVYPTLSSLATWLGLPTVTPVEEAAILGRAGRARGRAARGDPGGPARPRARRGGDQRVRGQGGRRSSRQARAAVHRGGGG